MSLVQEILQIIGLITIIAIVAKAIATRRSDLTFGFMMSRSVRTRLIEIEDLSGNKLIDVFRKALAVYDCLLRARAKGASILIIGADKSEIELDLR